MYNKSKFIRFFYYIFCQSENLKKYYYKNQWLNFDLANENPSDIKWENCYISPLKKFLRRFLIILLSLFFILVIVFINAYLVAENERTQSIILSLLPSIINVASSLIINKFTKFEKYSTKSSEIISDISKYFWLNFLVGISIFIIDENLLIFSYFGMEKYFYLNRTLMINMVVSIFVSQLSSLGFYLLNLIKRFSDSKYENGKITELKNKTKYEKLYLGPEFPFANRYAEIFKNFSMCLLYVIFFFFVIFLIVTFIVDK